MSSSEAKALATAQLMSKSLGLGVVLTILFGGIGLLYTNIPLGIIGLIVEIIVVIITFFTFGLGIVLIVPWHIITVIATIIIINRHNKRLLASL